jgi:hypothetical protein
VKRLAYPVIVALALTAPSLSFAADPPPSKVAPTTNGFPSPPPGWEVPPSPAPSAPSKKAPRIKAAACCAYDQLCCTRQSTIDETPPSRVIRVAEVRWSDIKPLVVKEATKDTPAIEGVPPARLIDGDGRHYPWIDGPRVEVRATPPGRFGEITWGGEWAMPFFADLNYRGMGYGIPHYVPPNAVPDKGKSMMIGPIAYLSFAQGESGTIIVDRVKGTLAGSPDVRATEWAHVEATPVIEGIVNAYRDKVGDDDRVVYLLPEVILAFESKDTKVTGGFLPVRGESTEAYTTYAMPAAPGRSGLSTFVLTNSQARRWFPRAKGAPEPPSEAPMALAASQTAAEAEPRLRVLFFAPLNPD